MWKPEILEISIQCKFIINRQHEWNLFQQGSFGDSNKQFKNCSPINKGFISTRRSFKKHPLSWKVVTVSQELENINPGSKHLIKYRRVQDTLPNSSSARHSPNGCSSVTGSTSTCEPRDPRNVEKGFVSRDVCKEYT